MNLKKKKRIGYDDDIVYALFCIYIVLQLLGITSVFYENEFFELIFKLCRYCCYFGFAFEIFVNRKSISLMEYGLIVLGILIFFFSKSRGILITVLILMSLKNLDLDRILELSLKVLTVSFSLVVFLSLLKIIPDWTYMRGNIVRHSLGFLYPTDCFSIYLVIVLLLLYNNKSNATWFQIILLEIINVSLFFLTNGRLSFILISIIILTMIILKIEFIRKFFTKKSTLKKMKIIGCAAPIFFLLLTNCLILLLPTNNRTIQKFDILLSRRITYSEKAYRMYGLSLFGQEIEWYGWGGYGYTETDNDFEYNYVDNSYARIMLDYGVVLTLLVIYAYTKLLSYCCDKKNIVLYIVIVFILIWSFVEPYLINISRNIFVASFILLLKDNTKNSGWLNEKINQKKLHI